MRSYYNQLVGGGAMVKLNLPKYYHNTGGIFSLEIIVNYSTVASIMRSI